MDLELYGEGTLALVHILVAECALGVDEGPHHRLVRRYLGYHRLLDAFLVLLCHGQALKVLVDLVKVEWT